MPGLIDAHGKRRWRHLTADIGFIHLAASAQAELALMRGLTTVRDPGGPAFALKKAIDSGLIAGPGIYPCNAIIS